MSTGTAPRNQYALAALKDHRAIVPGELAAIESQARIKREALAHLDAVLRLFAPEADPSAIPVRRPRLAALATTEKEWAKRAARHPKADMKRASVTYDGLADRLKEHGYAETKASIANKLAKATVPATFFLACLAALELEGVRLEEL